MEHLKKKTFISVDLETLSTNQNAVILSIGAVKFTIDGGLGSEFLVNVEPSHQKIKYGLHVSNTTMEFWAKQPKEIRDSWKIDPQTLPIALITFGEWIGNMHNTLLIANGAVFDFGVLRSAYEAVGMVRPWPYWTELDLRTISVLCDIKLSKGNEHTALGDAKNQAQQFINLFK